MDCEYACGEVERHIGIGAVQGAGDELEGDRRIGNGTACCQPKAKRRKKRQNGARKTHQPVNARKYFPVSSMIGMGNVATNESLGQPKMVQVTGNGIET